MKAIIAAGGSGTRLRPLTFSSNKHILPIANKPLLLYSIEAIAETGIKEVGIVVNETKPAIEALIGNGSQWGLSVSYINQEKPLGLAHVVKICRQFLKNDAFVYHLGDNIFTEGIKKPFNHFMKNKPNALLTIIEHEENYRMGVPFFDNQGKLMVVVEKPQNPPNKFGVPGLYFFDHHVFEAFSGNDAIEPSPRGELEITDLYNYMLKHHYQVDTVELDGIWMDPGKFIDMLKANAYVLSRNQEKVSVGKNCEMLSSKLIEPVVIGNNVKLINAKIGPNVSLQDNVTIEDADVRNSIIMSGTSISSMDRPIVDSMIGRNSVICDECNHAISLFVGDHCNVKLN